MEVRISTSAARARTTTISGKRTYRRCSSSRIRATQDRRAAPVSTSSLITPVARAGWLGVRPRVEAEREKEKIRFSANRGPESATD